MSNKIINRVVLILFAMFVAVFVYFIVSMFIPRSGVVASTSDLKKVFNKVGGSIACISTNSLIQEFPFDGPIAWKIFFFKEPVIFVTGKIETNGLHQFIRARTDTTFIWTGSSNELEGGWPSDNPCWPATVVWTNMSFKKNLVIDGYEASVEGNVDYRLHIVTLRSAGGWPVGPTK